jgi:transcriptional regulator with XRE-family HTH domain
MPFFATLRLHRERQPCYGKEDDHRLREQRQTYSPTSACPILNGNSSRPADLQIYRDIKARHLTQVQAGEILGIKQSHVSLLMRNRSGHFSVERLMDFLTALGYDVEIRVKRARKPHGQMSVVVAPEHPDSTATPTSADASDSTGQRGTHLLRSHATPRDCKRFTARGLPCRRHRRARSSVG